MRRLLMPHRFTSSIMENLKTKTSVSLILVTICSLVLVALLSFQNYELKKQLSQFEQSDIRLKSNDIVTPISGINLNGDSLQIEFRDKQTMLFFFTTTCPICKRNMPIWEELYQWNNSSHKFTIVGVSLDSVELTKKYIKENSIPFTVVIASRSEMQNGWKISHVPQTILIDQRKRVVTSILGIIDEKSKAALMN